MKLQEAHIDALVKAETLLLCCDYCPYLDLKDLLRDGSTTARERFQPLFIRYYGMNAGGLTASFKERYFQILFRSSKRAPDPVAILKELSRYKQRNGNKAIPFSFVSKLVSIHSESSPIIDRHVLKFFDMRLPSSSLSKPKRIEAYVELLDSIATDYKSWAEDARVARILKKLRRRDRRLKRCSDMRLLDFLVWKVGNQKLLKLS